MENKNSTKHANVIKKVHIRGYRKFKDFTFTPVENMNIIAGGNEAGKSTLIEAITLGLTGRVNGIRAMDSLNPYWFNEELVSEFYESKNKQDPPEFRIDIHFEIKTDKEEKSSGINGLQKLRGMNNMLNEDSVGISFIAQPDKDYKKELDLYFKDKDSSKVVPVEFYTTKWIGFDGNQIYKVPRGLGISLIDSRTIRSDKGIDFYTRNILETRIDSKTKSKVSLEHRIFRTNLGENTLKEINSTIEKDTEEYPGAKISLQVDQSMSASWERFLIPSIERVPFTLSGQGNQAKIKTILALGNSNEDKNYIFIEEPENHLSHTRLRELISYIETKTRDRQVFITTHSSYILNRLGLDQVTLLHQGIPKKFQELEKETIEFFKRLSGFDTMRLILADKIVIVEGPSDEIIFNYFFKKEIGKEPRECQVDVMSINGTSFKRYFELAALLNRQLFAIRDNDNKDAQEITNALKSYLSDTRQIFISENSSGATLEPQILNANTDTNFHQLLGLEKEQNVEDWMRKNKTESALKISISDEELKPPNYILNTIYALTGLK